MEIEVSNPAEGVDVFLMIVVCRHMEVCDCLIARPEDLYRVCCVSDREAPLMGSTWPVRSYHAVVGGDLVSCRL
jgi:hypothetical protein